MFSIEIDKRHNSVMIIFSGSFDFTQSQNLFLRLKEELPYVKKGFRLLMDLSKVQDFNLWSLEYIEKSMDLLNSFGVRYIMQIIPDASKDLGFNILSLFHYSKNVKINTFLSAEEMNNYLIFTGETSLIERVKAFLRLSRAKIALAFSHKKLKITFLAIVFLGLVILRTIMRAFGIALGYLYITIIAIAGFWFGVIGGVSAAVLASAIFIVEVAIFTYWDMRDLVLRTIVIRLFVYLISGVALGYLSDIQRKLRKQLEYLSGCDELTEFFNYRLSMNLLEKEIGRSRREKNEFSVAILDLDHFKSINDAHGHLVGNDVLKYVAGIIKRNTHNEDILGRYGGDEFIIIFPRTNVAQAVIALKRIKNKIAVAHITSPYLRRNNYVSVVFSAGVSSSAMQTRSANEIIATADSALYEAKRAGRNRIFIYGENNSQDRQEYT